MTAPLALYPEATCLLFDYGGTLDADGVAWKEQFRTLYRAEGLDLLPERFDRAFYDADDPLVGAMGFEDDLTVTVERLVANLEEQLGSDRTRGARVSAAFLANTRTAVARNRPVLQALRRRYRLGIVSNWYGNLPAIIRGLGLGDLFDVVIDSERAGVAKPDPAIFRAAMDAVGAEPAASVMIGDSLRRDGVGAKGAGMGFVWLAPAAAPYPPDWNPPRIARLDALTPAAGPIRWRAGVIAAGEGRRLREGGWPGSKAMARVSGRTLIDHALDRFAAAGVERVSVLINEASADACDHLTARTGAPSIDLVVRSTPSSHASFTLLAERLGGGPAIITTVDSIMAAGTLAGFLGDAVTLPEGAIVLGVTRHVDDEAPLWATLDPDGRMRRLGGDKGTHVTAGLYAWTGTLPGAVEDHARLRDYLGWLVASGRPVFGVELPQVLDVDRPADVRAAERALASWAAREREIA